MTAPFEETAPTDVIDIHPEIDEIALVNLPAGKTARVHHPAGPRDWKAMLPDEPLIATIPSDVTHVGWGASISAYSHIRGIRNGRHRRDRAVWDQAVRALRSEPVVYVRLERREYFGRDVWVAVSVRSGSEATQ